MLKSKIIIKVVDIVADDAVIDADEQIVEIEPVETPPVDIETEEVTPEVVPLHLLKMN